LLIIVLVGVFLIPRLFPDEGVKTLTEIHKENINDGKDTDTAYVYNGYSFVYYDGLWYTQVLNAINGNLYDVPLHYGPKDLTDVIVYGDFNTFFEGIINGNIFNYSKRYYLTFNPDDENMGYVALATGELTQNLVTTFDIAPVSACIEEGVGCEDVPIVTCENTDDPVLYLTSGEPTAVYAEGNCITVQGNKEELVRAVDRFVLKMYNVMI
ncbi:hypothetical protein COV16_04350, partial [Candidatus Woesearchaeota archaeon CG10_big_fil_rev_8_21_14_0_10_34_8]